jgi:hypothetical protein
MTKTINAWVSEVVAGRLLGQDVSIISKRAAKGHYGQARRTQTGGLLLHVRGLELAARRRIYIEQIEAAIAGEPLQTFRTPLTHFPKRPTIEQVGFEVARALDIIRED